LPPEVVFIGTGSGAADAFNKSSIVTSGLQQVVAIFPGRFKPRGSNTEYTPLLRTSSSGGTLQWSEAVRQGFMGPGGLNPNRPHFPKTYEVRLMNPVSDPREIPAEGENLVVVALVDRVMTFRVFDAEGKRVVDVSENGLRRKAEPIGSLRRSLAPFWTAIDLDKATKAAIAARVFDIVDYTPSGFTLAAEIKGDLPRDAEPPKDAARKDETKKAEPKKDRPKRTQLHAIAIADLDLISEEFFELRRQKVENLDLDNVTFVLNCVDVLAGDDAFVALRKRRIQHRTLTTIENRSKDFIEKYQNETKAAEDAAKKKLDEAQKQLDVEVDKVKSRTDLDERTKEIQLLNLQDVANRRLEVQKANIDDEKRKRILESRAESEQSIRMIQNRVRALAIFVPPLPPLLLGFLVFGLRLSRENLGANPNRIA
jgi:hypothetical protein